MSLPNLIGLHGLGRSGKDTVAELLYPYGFVRVAYADEVRADLLRLAPYVPTAITPTGGGEFVTLPLAVALNADFWNSDEGRRLQQRYATEVRRAEDPNVWIARAQPKIDAELRRHRRVVVSDVRFENEARSIRDQGGIVVAVCGRGGLAGLRGEHSSEAGIPPELISEYIRNDGTLEDLTATVDTLVDELVRRPIHRGSHL